MAFYVAVAGLGIGTPYEGVLADEARGDAATLALLKGIIATESQWDPRAINPTDPSYGLMQILLSTAQMYAPGVTPDQLLDDPALNIRIGSAHLRMLRARYSESDAVAAYNAGVPRKNAAGQYVNSRGDPKVQAYVDSVFTYQDWYLNHEVSVGGGVVASEDSLAWFWALTGSPEVTASSEAPAPTGELAPLALGAGALLLLGAGVLLAVRS